MAIIQSGLEAVEMRNKMESKEALATKGSLYVGTGGTTTITKSDNSTVPIPVTTAFNPPNTTDANGGVMIWDTSENSTTGWTVDKVGKDNIKDAAITPEKLDPTKEYTVKSITANGNVIIQFERDNVTWAGVGMQYAKNGNYGGEIRVPDRSMSVPETFATEEEIKRQIENGEIVAQTAEALQGWYRHFVMVNLTKGSGASAAVFKVFFELFTRSGDQITDMPQLITAIQTFGDAALATGAGYVGTGAQIPDAYHIHDNILENRVYNVLRVEYDDRLSTKACCILIAKTTVSNISSEGYDFNIVAMDKFNDVYIVDVVSFLFS